MPTRLPTLALRARPPTEAATPTATSPTTTTTKHDDAPSAPSPLVHKPLSAISRFGSTFFNRKTIVATNKVEPTPPTVLTRSKRNSISDLPVGMQRRGSTESDLLSSLPAGDLAKLMTKHSRSARNIIKLTQVQTSSAVDLHAAAATQPPVQAAAAKEDDTRQADELATLTPHRPPTDQHSSSGSTTTHAPRRPPLSKKVSANDVAMTAIVSGVRGGSSRTLVHFDRAKIDSFGGGGGGGADPVGLHPPMSQLSQREDSSHQSDPPVYTGQYVLDRFYADLTPFEKKEILAFSEVFYYSSIGVKRRRQNGRVVSPTTDGEVLAEAAAFSDKSGSSRSDTDSQTPKSEVFNDGYDDDRGDYVMLMQDHLAYRYEVLHPLGSGSFGQVVCCLDHLTKTKVAVKVIRNRKKYKEQAQIEISVLTQLQEHSGEDKVSRTVSFGSRSSVHHVVQMVEHFVFRNHLCITFELLGMNLYDYLKLRFFQGMPMANMRVVATQLLKALTHLRAKHIVHCDLKPENVLIKSPLQCFAAGPGYSSVAYANVPVDSICLIDFGSSCLDNATIYTYIQSRFYRSPEVILGHPYGTAIDMWSFGCILVELHTGHPVFAGENETEQLMCMMEILGIPDTGYLSRCKRRKYFFQEVSAPAQGDDVPTDVTVGASSPSATSNVVYKPMPFTNSRGRKRFPGRRELGIVVKSEEPDFVALVRKCFIWDPTERITPEAALQEPWILSKETLKSTQE